IGWNGPVGGLIAENMKQMFTGASKHLFMTGRDEGEYDKFVDAKLQQAGDSFEEQLRNLAENACKGYLVTAEMWVLAYERAVAALRRLQNAAASAPSSSSAFAAPQSGAPGGVDDNEDEQGDPCFALAAAVLAQACEIELVSDSAHPRHLLCRFRLWVRLDHGHAHAIPAAADYTVAPLTLELREDFVDRIIIRSWAIFVTSAAPDASAPGDAAAAATLSAIGCAADGAPSSYNATATAASTAAASAAASAATVACAAGASP
ncbi:hypothetical protein HK405_012155, partial [Cladochytrium tenue]